MYSVNDKKYNSYLKAVEAADKSNSTVIEVKTGTVRWQPAAKVTEEKIREYNSRMNAYKAQRGDK